MNILEIGKFISAGKAKFVLLDKRNDRLFKYKVTRLDNVWFVSVKLSTEGESGYAYIGLISNRRFRHTAKSIVTEDSPSFYTFELLFLKVLRGQELPDYLEFAHVGECGRCGRELTDPISIELGFGSECIKKI